MCNLLRVDCIWFTILDYPMSYIEFIGTVFYLLSAWLIARRNILTWPTGIISVILYMLLFYQIRLFSDTLEQGYYLVVSVYGWISWRAAIKQANSREDFSFSSRRSILLSVLVTLFLALLLFTVTRNIHHWLPALVPEPASFPFLDALTTTMSFTAMWLITRKRVESWVYWIIVDIIGIGLYYVKEVRFIALLYIILLVTAIYGLINWTISVRRLPVEEGL